jgi:UDPglucose 6-dehydrogenase|tara:strand:+ start:6523 stop:7725 length:1203 start_codon:yes stop_codon:yes gene_type:complete
MMNITIIGAGYVGLITGVGFAKLNNNVSIVDLNHNLINQLKNNNPPFYEPDLDSYLKNETVSNNIKFYTDYESGISKNTEVVFVCVQTPTNLDSGNTETKFVESALETLKKLENNFNICIKSTIKSELIELLCDKYNIDFNKIIFNPEFLREGSAFYDFFNPDRIVIGGLDKNIVDNFSKIYDSFDCKIVITDPKSSQLIKYLSNTYLAMRLSFVNETYKLVHENGGDPLGVIEAMGLDKRIGNHYFRPSPGWGGSCFPKDVKEVVFSYQENYELPLMSNIIKSNDLQIDWFVEYLHRISVEQNLTNIVLIGAPFKENTDDLRESPTLKIYNKLKPLNGNISIYDSRINLGSEYTSITTIEELKKNCLYVEMFPDESVDREVLISKIKSLENTFIFKMWI